MYKNFKNLKLKARINDDHSFAIYLDASGREYFLMNHRRQMVIYEALRFGIRMEDLKAGRIHLRNKWVCPKNVTKKGLAHICKVADEFIEYELMEKGEEIRTIQVRNMLDDFLRCA